MTTWAETLQELNFELLTFKYFGDFEVSLQLLTCGKRFPEFDWLVGVFGWSFVWYGGAGWTVDTGVATRGAAAALGFVAFHV